MNVKRYLSRFGWYFFNILVWLVFIMIDFYHLTITKTITSPAYLIMSCFIFMFWMLTYIQSQINDRINTLNRKMDELATHILDYEDYKEYKKISEDDIDVK